MKAKEIQDLIDFISKSGLDEVNIETEEFKIKVKKNSEVKTQMVQAAAPAPQPVAAQAPAPANTPPASEKQKDTGSAEEGNYLTIKSPMIGTFYRTPNPESPNFVNVGDSVKAGDTVCIVEAMKLFNEIESDVTGKIVKILVDNASPVEYDQPLFLVDPS